MKRKHVFNNVEMHFGLWKYTFLVMQKYGHDESVPYAWRNVRCGIPIRSTHYYNIYNTSSQTVHNIIVTRPQLVYFVMVTHSENKNPLFALQKPYFCTPKTPFLHAKKGVFALLKRRGCTTKMNNQKSHYP